MATLACAPLGAPRAEILLPPEAEARLNDLATRIEAIRSEGRALALDARALRALIENDPRLGGRLLDRLNDLIRGTRNGRVLVPELEVFLMSYVLAQSTRPGRAPPNGALRLTTPDGARADAAFRVSPTTGTAAPVRDYRLVWEEMPPAPLSIALGNGVLYSLAGDDCPEAISGSGDCRISVRFSMTGNGIRGDQLSAEAGPHRAFVRLEGEGVDFPPANLEFLSTQFPTVRLDPAAPSGPTSITLTVVNRGDGPMPPFESTLRSRATMKPVFWRFDAAGTCSHQTLAPGGQCTIVLVFEPTYNGQDSAEIDLDERGRLPGPRKRAAVFGYARGFVETVPDGVLTNGDPCPAEGTAAEIVTYRGEFRSGEATELGTVACRAWQAQDGGTLACSDPGLTEGGTSRTYRRASASDAWRLFDLMPFTRVLTCRNGILERIDRMLPSLQASGKRRD